MTYFRYMYGWFLCFRIINSRLKFLFHEFIFLKYLYFTMPKNYIELKENYIFTDFSKGLHFVAECIQNESEFVC